MKKILIINREQFGYHTDSLFYCKYLKKYFSITYLCFDHGLNKKKDADINVIYLKKTNISLYDNYRFIKYVNSLKRKYDLLYIYYFKLAFLINMMFKNRNYILDIRTGSIKNNDIFRSIDNKLIKYNTYFFKNLVVISNGLSNMLKLNINKVKIIKLGSNIISKKNIKFNSLHLIYVGTFENRNIDQTIIGFKKFIDLMKNIDMSIKYDIIGFGKNDDVQLIKKTINKLNLQDRVKYLGRIPRDSLKNYFENSNIGISYVPITNYFNFQPVTKTYEYLNSGIPVIATATNENKNIISEINGVLTDDNPESFCDALKQIHKNMKFYDSNKIRNSAKDYTWENIVKNNLLPYIKNILGDK